MHWHCGWHAQTSTCMNYFQVFELYSWHQTPCIINSASYKNATSTYCSKFYETEHAMKGGGPVQVSNFSLITSTSTIVLDRVWKQNTKIKLWLCCSELTIVALNRSSWPMVIIREAGAQDHCSWCCFREVEEYPCTRFRFLLTPYEIGKGRVGETPAREVSYWDCNPRYRQRLRYNSRWFGCKNIYPLSDTSVWRQFAPSIQAVDEVRSLAIYYKLGVPCSYKVSSR